jgi:hypothetical protein
MKLSETTLANSLTKKTSTSSLLLPDLSAEDLQLEQKIPKVEVKG